MSIAEIKHAVAKLSPQELAEVAVFINRLDDGAWANQIEADAKAGKLDFLFAEADEGRASGKLRDFPTP